MIILSDIIIDHGYTTDDIIIDSLTHYQDLNSDALLPSAMILKTNSNIVPYVILFDDSVEKKDSVILPLKSYCGKISNSMIMPINHHNMQLVTSVDKCILKTNANATSNDLKFSCVAEVVAYSYIAPSAHEALVLKTTISENLHNEVSVIPIGCKLTKLDNILLRELDPFSLHELDFYGVGTHLSLSELDIETQIHINEDSNYIAQLQSSADLEVSPRLMYYDEYLLMNLDKYSLRALDDKI